MEEAALRFVSGLIGKRLLHVCCEAEILDVSFGSLVLHAMGASRILKNGNILVTVPDYQSWDGLESTHNDEWFNLDRFRPEIVGGTVTAAEVRPWHDLRLELDNGVTIECLVANGQPYYGEELEQWVLFELSEERPGSGAFLTVSSGRVRFRGRSAAYKGEIDGTEGIE